MIKAVGTKGKARKKKTIIIPAAKPVIANKNSTGLRNSRINIVIKNNIYFMPVVISHMS